MINGGRFLSDRVTEVHLCDLAAENQHFCFYHFFLVENEWLFISLRGKIQTILQKCLGVK